MLTVKNNTDVTDVLVKNYIRNDDEQDHFLHFLNNDSDPVDIYKLCPSELSNIGAGTLSTAHVWEHLRSTILDTFKTVKPELQDFNTTQMSAYTAWIEQIYTYYTTSKLRRSIMNPAPSKSVIRLLKLIDEVKKHNKSLNGTDTKNEKRNIRILVIGGSVTAGHGCTWPENLGIHSQRGNIPHKDCAWSTHLEKLLNAILFHGDEIIKIDNLSSGGQTSEFGALLLEYRLFPNPEMLPDVVIAAFSANESKEPNTERVLYEFMQDFVKASNGIHPCDNHAPLTIMLDDFYGDMPYAATLQTGRVYMVSTWNDLMAVNYGSTIKYKVLIESDGEKHPHPLLSSTFNIHNGVAMHIGIAITLSYNMIHSMVNVCGDETLNNDLTKFANETYDTPYHWNISNIISFDGINETRDSSNEGKEWNTNPIDPNLLSDLKTGEPPIQFFGPIRQGIDGDATTISKEYKKNYMTNVKICEDLKSSGQMYEQKCSYSWIVSRLSGGFERKEAVQREMDKRLLSNNGWVAEGYPIRQPRTGWYTHTSNATFSIKIENTAVDTNFVLILSMKSYGPNFVDSKLAVSTSVISKNSTTIQENVDDITSSFEDNWNEDNTFIIDGFHTTKTSVHFPHKVPLTKKALAGDDIILNVKLVGGSYFKIGGIAFCSY